MGYFKDVTPESVGISSKGIMKFLDRMEANQIELHSFMVLRHGQCAAKGWWKPYDEKFRHPLYSFSKSLTATAIGFAQQEGILSVDHGMRSRDGDFGQFRKLDLYISASSGTP